MNVVVLTLAAWLLCWQSASAADTVRICTYNALKYSVSNEDGRIPLFKRVLDSIRPDILLCQEVDDASLGSRFPADVLTWASFAASPYIDGPDTDNQLLFDQAKFTYLGQRRITTTLRDIAEFTLATRPTNGLEPDTLVLYSVHLKASNDDASAAQRAREVDRLLASLTTHRYAVIAGDFNIYSPQEAAYTKLVGPAATRVFVDPLGTSWVRNSSTFAAIYTQCTRNVVLGSCGGGVDGGVDDRFDYILTSADLAGRVVPNSYTAFGNDGVPRLNSAIDDPPNQRVSAEMAAALKCASDHLPLYVDIVLGDVQASVEGAMEDSSWLRHDGNGIIITNINAGDAVQLFDVNGRLRLETSSASTSVRIDTSVLPAGAYGLRAGSRWTSIVLP